MTPKRDMLKYYEKWFKALAIEFLELPYQDQNEVLTFLGKFQADCLKVHAEAKNVKERLVNLSITKIVSSEDNWVVYGLAEKIPVQFNLSYKPDIKHNFQIPVYSLDGIDWYSSKTELIEKDRV